MPEIRMHELRDRACAQGLASETLALRAGCSIGHLKNVLGGTENPSSALAHRLAAAVGMPAADLIIEADASPSPIRQARLGAGLGVSDLAARSGCTPQHINNIEAGRRTPSIGLLTRIADVLGRSPGELLSAQDAA
jgi:transcriptional regulator with XRE-family HTH domain